MEFDEDDSGDIGECSYDMQHYNRHLHAIIVHSRRDLLPLTVCVALLSLSLYIMSTCRYHGIEANDGKAGPGQDSPGTEKDDSRG